VFAQQTQIVPAEDLLATAAATEEQGVADLDQHLLQAAGVVQVDIQETVVLEATRSAASGTRAGAGFGGGAGGGGRGGSADSAGSGGGVGIYGEGESGLGGFNSGSDGGGGFGGSGGTNASQAGTSAPGNVYGTGNLSTPGLYGGGGCGADNTTNEQAPGGNGAVRIIWGEDRAFPSTNTADNEGGFVFGNKKNSGIWDLQAVYNNFLTSRVDVILAEITQSNTQATYTIPSTAQPGDLLVLYQTAINASGDGLPTLITNEADGFTLVTSTEAERVRSLLQVKVLDNNDLNKTITGMSVTFVARYLAVLYRGDKKIKTISVNNTYTEQTTGSTNLTTPVMLSPNPTSKITLAFAILQLQSEGGLSVSGVDTDLLAPNTLNFFRYGTSNSKNQTMTFTITSQSGTYRMAQMAFINIDNS
jgi:hypothetical protein